MKIRGWFEKRRKAARFAPRPKTSVRPALEALESRLVLYSASGNLWPNPQLITISFVPDGTNLGGATSNLFSAFNSNPKLAGQWQSVILKAAQVWAQQTNINFAVVPDDGAPSGSGNYEQGDPGYGDIRIGGYAFGSSTLGLTYQPPPVNNFSLAGDVAFNTGQKFNIGSTYDLFTVAAHEIGHALGLNSSSTSSAAVMWGCYNGIKTSLNSDDIAGIQSIYGGPRSPDAYEAQGLGTSFGTAVNLDSQIGLLSGTALVNNLNLATTSDAGFYTFNAPLLTNGSFTVTAQSSGLSQLSPNLTIYAADQKTVVGFASGLNQDGTTLTVNVTGALPLQQYYAVVQGADTSAFSTGAYALALNFGNGPTPTAPSPMVAIPNGNPITAGGGQDDFAANGDPFLNSVPVITGISPDTGLSSSDGVTDVPNLFINGQAPIGTTIQVYNNGQFIGTAIPGPSSSLAQSVNPTAWTFNNTRTTLPDGTYEFTATATDSLGNVSAASFPFTVIIDTQKPAATTIAGVSAGNGSSGSGGNTNFTTPIVLGTAQPNSEVIIANNGQVVGTTFANIIGAWSYTSSALTSGTYAFTATDISLAGEVSAPSSAFKLQIGGNAPISSVSMVVSSSAAGSSTAVFVGVATAGSVVTILDGNTVIGTATANAFGLWFFVDQTLGAGTQTITTEATNASGITGLLSSGLTITG